MSSNELVWPDPIIRKIRSFASSHFSADETFDHILNIIIEAEELMLNKVISRTYWFLVYVASNFNRIKREFKI